jgi:hypothetical protein
MSKNSKILLAVIVSGIIGFFVGKKSKQSNFSNFAKGGGMFPCPEPTKNLELNTRNRNKAIKADWIKYGPLNLSDSAYYTQLAKHWDTSVAVAKKSTCGNCAAFDVSPRMKGWMSVGQLQDKDGAFGYCWMHKFKCHSARTCYTWAKGGAITTDKVSYGWQEKNQ